LAGGIPTACNGCVNRSVVSFLFSNTLGIKLVRAFYQECGKGFAVRLGAYEALHD
jgi:hypothetical protein